MHIPDGFIDVQTSAIFAGLAAAGVATALKGARTQLDEKTAPLAGLTAVFIFAVQMLNFPVAAGTSGHLLGGALAAVLVGPWAATLALAVVLIMQGFLFAELRWSVQSESKHYSSNQKPGTNKCNKNCNVNTKLRLRF